MQVGNLNNFWYNRLRMDQDLPHSYEDNLRPRITIRVKIEIQLLMGWKALTNAYLPEIIAILIWEILYEDDIFTMTV